ncbi:uncharacterized protein LOC130691807 [Daphnia carinata]|uniref:uncharacterized protein LOC130691807 n=1 Tax=Daphnia carinata TaxID=120202 RepID=UPI002868D72E|nr:uncharacterized protein LOC130691807 [Daphnia carinata]
MSDLSSSATTEKTPIPKSSETAIPITAESSTPATGETAIIITEEIATPVQGETSIPMTEETGTLEIEETSIPMTEMDSDKPEDPELVPDSEDQSFKELGQLLNDFGSGTLRFTGMTNGILGVLLFFLQLWAILVSPKGVDMDLFGMLAGIYLLMLAFMKFEK